MPAEKKKFIEGWEDPKGISSIPGALKLGVSKEVAEHVFAEMESFAQYAFNKSHAAAYAFLTYQTAYLKCYYELYFLCSVLNNRITNSDEIKKYVTYIKSEGFEVLPPNINKSKTYFSVENGNLRFGLAAIKNVGVALIDSIIEEREKNGEFKDFMDFIKRVDTAAHNKRCLESLILAGAFDCFGVYRSQLMSVYDIAVAREATERKKKASGQFSLFDAFDTTDTSLDDKLEFPPIKEFNKDAKLKFEKEVVGIYISGNPLDDYLDKFKEYSLKSTMLEVEETDAENGEDENLQFSHELVNDMKVTCGGILLDCRKTVTKNGNREMGFASVEDPYGTIDLMFFPDAYRRFKHLFVDDNLVTIKGHLSLKDNEKPIVIVEDLIPWQKNDKPDEKIEEKPKQRLCLRFDVSNIEIYNKVVTILANYPGESEVCVRCTQSGKAFKMNNKVTISNLIENELCGVLDEGNIVIQ